MSKYILEIDATFEKGECYKCPCFLEIELCCDERAVRCAFGGNYEECPLEEVTVAKNATTSEPSERKDLDE